MSDRPDLRINGRGSASGGTYGSVVVNGSADIHGDTDCKDFECRGHAGIAGSLRAESASFQGAGVVRGNVEVGDLRVQGGFDADGTAKLGKLKLQGGGSFGGDVTAADIDVKGGLKVEGNCSGEDVKIRGGFNIQGLLNVETLDAKVFFGCSAKEIGGGKISVEGRGGIFWFRKLLGRINIPFAGAPGLTVETVEGDDVYLEHTNARVVRGNRVRIGGGCNIGLVEFRQTYDCAADSTVTECKRTGEALSTRR